MKKAIVNNEDPSYILDHTGQRSDPGFKRYIEQIKSNGFILVGNVKIYNQYLFEILITEKLRVKNGTTLKDSTIRGIDYLRSYIEGFNEGMEYFNNEFGVTAETFYKNSNYIHDIHKYYLKIKSIKESFPLMFNHASIKEFGHKSGIIGGIDELIEKRPTEFQDLLSKDVKRRIKKPYDSLRRVYSFILTEAFYQGKEKLLRDCSVQEFNEIIKRKFKKASPRPIYVTVRSTYKEEYNFLNKLDKAKTQFPKDYNYAMKIFKNYYPD